MPSSLSPMLLFKKELRLGQRYNKINNKNVSIIVTIICESIILSILKY